MTDHLKQIALRIRELREIAGDTPESVAKEFNLPLETYYQYENGEADIPVSLLYGIAGKYNVELTAILTGDNPKLRNYSLVRKGKGVSVERTKAYSYRSLAYNFLQKRAEPFLVTVDPEIEETPVHYNSHPGQEFNYVLEGCLKVVINGYELILNGGDSLYFDSSQKHGMKALNGKKAVFLAVII